MTREIINSNNAPAPIGPYNQAIKANGFLFVSGQIPINAATNELSTSTIEEATHCCLKNVVAILDEAGLTIANVVKVSIFVTDMSLFGRINDVYGIYFSENAPARELVQVVALPKNVPIEISVVAAV